MLSLAYTISDELKEELTSCENLRRSILLTVLPPKTELKLRWQSQVLRIGDLLNFLGFPASRNEIVPFLVAPSKTSSPPAQAVLAIRNTLEYLTNTWIVSPKPVTFSTLETLSQLAPPKAQATLRAYNRRLEKPLNQLLDYVQTQNEPAILSAGISLIQTILLTDASPEGLYLGRLLAYLFLYKGGCDLGGLLVLGDGSRKALGTMLEVASVSRTRGNATNFLMYFAQATRHELTRLTDTLNAEPTRVELPSSFWELNRRQELVLRLLADPTTKVTNRDVQKACKVSQITASRDLAKLATLGLIYPHGKGRSVYYTKI